MKLHKGNRGQLIIISTKKIVEVFPDAEIEADCRAHHSERNKEFCKKIQGLLDGGRLVVLISTDSQHLDRQLRARQDAIILTIVNNNK